ncbi:hypothetical protein GCM10011297_03330 [Bacterioplanes sanyensis]|uniref:TonB family protein n=1 Tax=Bacterioplanes sanyensis TaxID=1249553 RepID=UPI00167ACFD3|nr:TonB family protein [Bacterioplanes sanyensis]GGY33665.1 hypothetical protein GCM10011297_03330 [Bacterioplanes sanyensis]
MQQLRWCGLLTMFYACMVSALPPIQGTAVYQRLNTDMFRATVYSEAPEWRTWMEPNARLVLEMRVVSDSMSARRFYRIWNEALAINLNDEQLRRSAEPIGRFLRCVKGTLQPGDVMQISNLEGRSQVTINDVEVLDWPQPELVPLLANAWAGSVPYSPAFQRQLFSLDDRASALAAVEAIQPAPGRKQVIREWMTPEPKPSPEPVALAQAQPQPKPQPKPQPSLQAQAQTEAKPASNQPQAEPQRDAKVQSQTPKQSQPETANVASQSEPKDGGSTAPAAAPVLATVASPETAAVESATESIGKSAGRPEADADGQNLSPQAVAAEDSATIATDAAEPVVSEPEIDWAALQMAEIEYYRTLIAQATKAVRYPKRALMRGYEGEVRVLVKLDASGEVKEVTTSSSSRVSVLDRAAEEAVVAAAPYPPAPQLLDENMLEFELPFRFALTD